MDKVGNKQLPWIQLSINELRYLIRCDEFLTSRYTNIPDVIPERSEVTQIGKLYPILSWWKNHVGNGTSFMYHSRGAIPFMDNFTEDYLEKFHNVGALSEGDIDFAVAKGLLRPSYAGPAKLKERVDQFHWKMQDAQSPSKDYEEIERQFNEQIRIARDKHLISVNCASELTENHLRAIYQLEGPVFVPEPK